jgi:predicted NAD-dependent protein-ADP-ribosyltransferase YbiA (DUF1768 family)
MDIRSKRPGAAGALSNFTPRKFTVRGVECNSMEGFLQSLKFKNAEMQKEVCKLTGFAAKKRGSKKNWQESQTLWWQGEAIKRESDEYQKLLADAFESLYKHNEKAKSCLLSTGSATLTHSIGRSNPRETVLTEREYCRLLMRIRGELQSEGFFDF